jgi:ABC-type proline/glycine betaine transport system ATPase subunit
LLAAIKTLLMIPVVVTFVVRTQLLRGVIFGTVKRRPPRMGLAMSTAAHKQLTKRFGQFASVSEVNIAATAGVVVCLLGLSGCGKTTALRIIAGLE